MSSANLYNKRLWAVIFLTALIVCVRLYFQADLTGNWRGFYISSAHTALVALVAAVSLKRKA